MSRYDADAAVHGFMRLAARVGPIGEMFPEAVRDGAVDRAALGQIVLKDGAKLAALEKVVHPLAGNTGRFSERTNGAGATHVLLDIPLLFETGAMNLSIAWLSSARRRTSSAPACWHAPV